MDNNLTFSIERLFGPAPDKKFKGFFVTKSNEEPVKSNPMSDIMKMAMEQMGEAQAVPKPKDSGRIFCETPKEVQDYIIYELGEFVGPLK